MIEFARSLSSMALWRSLRRLATILAPPLLVICGSAPALAIPGPIPFQYFRMTASGSCKQTGVAGVNCIYFQTRGTASVIGAVKLTVSSFSISPNAQTIDNGQGGFCYMASGGGTLVGTYQGYRFGNGFNLSGMLCDVGPAGAHEPQTFSGTYLSRGYAESQGTVVWSDDGNGKILVSVKGNLRR